MSRARPWTIPPRWGPFPVRDDKGKKIAEVGSFPAYVLDGPRDAKRPITFAFNGGPGAASVYLNLGAIGPKRISVRARGTRPLTQPALVDNPGTWMDFADMVFIDPVGHRLFSQPRGGEAKTEKHFFQVRGGHRISLTDRL